MSERRVRVLSSVAGGAIDDLVGVLARMPGWRADRVAPLSAARWRRLRAAGPVGSVAARLLGALFPVRAAVDPAVVRGADVLVATTNPFWLPIAVTLRPRRPPVVALVYDVYPDSLEVRLRLPRPLRAILDAVVRSGLRRADAVVFLGRRTRAAVVARHGLTRPTAVIPTGADPDRFDRAATPPAALAAVAADLAARRVVAYVGNAGSVHDVATLGGALARVLADRSDVGVVLAVTGDRAQDLVGPVRGHPGVHVLGPLDDAAWRWVVAHTDVALVALDRTAGLASLPSKAYPALAAGTPLLAVAPAASDLADLVDAAAPVGLRVDPGDVAGAVEALARLLGDDDLRVRLGAAAAAAAADLTPDALAPRWAALLARLPARPGTGAS